MFWQINNEHLFVGFMWDGDIEQGKYISYI